MPKVPFWVFIFIGVLYFTAIRVDTMDIDASQYAEISREMLKSGDYLHIYDRGVEYLDKPPFLFWVSAASMKVFGVNNFGYKFPSILFALWAIFATYKLGKKLYGEVTGRMGALVLASCQGMFLMTNDIRCDTILMSWTITAIWLIQEWVDSRKLWYLLGGSAAIAFGMMTKGPLALMVPVFCFISDWVLKRQWKNFFNPYYILSIILIGILLIPMSIGLYQQFDLHPEKMVNGVKGVSGLRFFYWSQSFGRITGESPWKNGVDMSFLIMNMLWSFLPWIFLFIPALVLNTVQLVKQKFRLQPQQEWLTTGGFLLTYLSLGSSAYQLPHYIFIAFPLAAIVTARLITQMVDEGRYKSLLKIMRPFQVTAILLLFLASLILVAYAFPAPSFMLALWVAGLAGWLFIAFKKGLKGKLFWLSAGGMVIINIFLTNHMYSTLLDYQAGSQSGKFIHSHSIVPENVAIYKMDDPLNSIQFYAQGSIISIDTLPQLESREYVLTMEPGIKSLSANGYKFDVAMQAESFKVSELTLPFLNPKTRATEVKKYYLVKLRKS
jgi:4-amino-4-deoxy-L-arabinose transferase-like glycosyltransferase